MAASSLSHVSQENVNFSRLSKLLIDGCTQVLKKVFDGIHPPKDLRRNLFDKKTRRILKNLLSKKILFKKQWDKLYPTGSTVDSSSFDITLLCLLLRSICNLTPPIGGWDSPPLPTSTNKEDDIVRIKLARNHLYGHIKEAAITDADFSKHWDDLQEVLVRLGGADYKDEIAKLKVVTMDHEERKYYIQCIEEWRKNDENLMKELERTEKRLTNKMEETHHELGEKIDEATEEIKKVQSMLQTSNVASGCVCTKDAESYSEKLKSTMKNQLEVHQENLMTPLIEKLKLQDIFTNLIIQDAPRREYSKTRKSDKLRGKTQNEIKKSADLFLSKKTPENPKSIWIVGNAGIGKSLFCRKIAHEWSTDSIFDAEKEDDNPSIKFTFLITFRQLNELTDKSLNLKELLNLCPMLDESTLLNDSVMQYIIEHPEQLCVLMDGFDEYAQSERHRISSDFETSFPNNPMTEMPVTALVSKLIKKKILRDSVVMVTSRPGEADVLENIRCDRFVKINGFSLEQVMEYVGKYFSSNEEMKAQALSNIKESQYFLRFGRVPLMCLMMCVYMESQIMEGSSKCLPDKLTDFYSDVVLCIERRYNKAIKKACFPIDSSVQNNLDNLAKLAALSTVHNKYSFGEGQLENLDIPEKELMYLKSSSLLFCEDGVRKSLLSELSHSYSFSHRTFQEYFTARYFVQMNEIPPQKDLSPLVFQFMAGLMNPQKDEESMKRLLEHIEENEKNEEAQARLSLKCMYEYGNEEFVKRFGTKSVERYFDGGLMRVRHLNLRIISVLVNALSSFRYVVRELRIIYSVSINVTVSDIDVLLSSLRKKSCPIIDLRLTYSNIDDECAMRLCNYLPETKLTRLFLSYNKITDNGVKAMIPYCGKLKHLDLSKNQVVYKRQVYALFKEKCPHVFLIL